METSRPAHLTHAFARFVAGESIPAPAWPSSLFAEAVASVPAYGKFLREHGIDPASVTTEADFRRLPLTGKDSYYRRYPLPELCRGGRLEGCDMIAMSSGSSGTPTIWPRTVTDELFGGARLPTLVQYDPASRFFEELDGTLLFSGDNGIPLIRYHIADEGGVISYHEMFEFCGRNGFRRRSTDGDDRGGDPPGTVAAQQRVRPLRPGGAAVAHGRTAHGR